jgi:hypothetical protein
MEAEVVESGRSGGFVAGGWGIAAVGGEGNRSGRRVTRGRKGMRRGRSTLSS